MIDLHYYKKREREIRKIIGINPNGNIFDANEMFSVYFNPSNGRMTGIRDNEREKFYHFTQEDIMRFVNMVNQREFRTSEFLQGIELQFKRCVDREIDRYELMEKCFDEKKELEKQLNPFINLANDYNLTLDGLYDAFEELLKEKFKGVE